MANIMFYGFAGDQFKKITARIGEIFANKPYRDDYVVTFVPSVVLDHPGQSQPFIRLATHRGDGNFEDVFEELKKLGFYIEPLFLEHCFDPKKQ